MRDASTGKTREYEGNIRQTDNLYPIDFKMKRGFLTFKI